MLMHKGTERLLTERLELRRFTMEDLEYMFTNWASDPEVARYITWPAHKDRDVTSDVMKRWMEHYPNPNFYQWAIVVKELNQPIGSISVVNSSEGNEHCEIGYCIGRAFWNKGYTTEALKCVMNFLFHEVGYERIEAQYQKDNLGSGMVMKKAGMSYEGIKRHAYKNRDDQFVDLVLYGMIKDDWMTSFPFDKDQMVLFRLFNDEDSIDALTLLLNQSYKFLLDMGLNYVAATQDNEVTRSRVGKAYKCFIGELNKEIISTIALYKSAPSKICKWYSEKHVAKMGQFAVLPKYQKKGIGDHMLALIEFEASKIQGVTELALDTAETAHHLIQYYQDRGFRYIETIQWDETNYKSVVMSKTIARLGAL